MAGPWNARVDRSPTLHVRLTAIAQYFDQAGFLGLLLNQIIPQLTPLTCPRTPVLCLSFVLHMLGPPHPTTVLHTTD